MFVVVAEGVASAVVVVEEVETFLATMVHLVGAMREPDLSVESSCQ